MDQVSDAAGASGAKREIVLVSGMHRSGTSAFTRVCNLAGGALPQPLVEPALGNELGHWEPAEVVAMNDRALLSAGGDVNSVFPVSPHWLRSKAAEDFTAEVEAYINRLGDTGQTWFIKDPRISLLAGLWTQGVERAGVVPRLVIAFRNPWEVAASLTKRQLHHFPDEVWPAERGLSLWLNYMVTIERKTRGLPRSFVSYEGFLSDWSSELHRIYWQLGLPQPELGEEAREAIGAFLRPDERHARHETMQTRGGLATEVYQLLLERVADPDGGKDALNKAGRTFAASFDVLGGYVSALEARTAEYGPLKAEASRAQTESLALKQATQTLELRMMHLARAGAATGSVDGPQAAPAADAALPSELLALQHKHDALKAAHKQNVQAFQAERLTHQDTAARLALEFETELQSKEDRVVELKRELVAQQWAQEAAALAGRSLALKTSAQQEVLQEVQDARQEVQDGREAYEALRLEAADLHIRVRAAEAVVDDARRAIVTADAIRAELSLIHRSRSWKITAPLRGATTLLGRR